MKTKSLSYRGQRELALLTLLNPLWKSKTEKSWVKKRKQRREKILTIMNRTLSPVTFSKPSSMKKLPNQPKETINHYLLVI